jgi:hypothetical protein
MGDQSKNIKVSVTFTYPVADYYLAQTNSKNLTGTWTYTGPDKIWIFVDNTTKKIIGRFHYTEADDGADIPTPEGQTKVLVDANVNPDIASLCHGEIDYATLPHGQKTHPDDSQYLWPEPTPPDHTYELTEIQYDATTNTFIKPYPWKKPHITWEELLTWRNGNLAGTDESYNKSSPSDKAHWAAYRQWMRDLTATHQANGVNPWEVIPPLRPDELHNDKSNAAIPPVLYTPVKNPQITSTTGVFSCDALIVAPTAGQPVKITGTFSSGSITGYTSGATYYVVGSPTTTAFQLSSTAGGGPITSTVSTGTITGIDIKLTILASVRPAN